MLENEAKQIKILQNKKIKNSERNTKITRNTAKTKQNIKN